MAVSIAEPFAHDIMPRAVHDEHARENATLSMKLHMTYSVYGGDRAAYRHNALDRFTKSHGRAPADKTEVRHLMMAEPFTQMWSAIARNLQEMLWDNVGGCVERQLPDLIDAAQEAPRKAGGSLRLNPQFKMPRYLSAVDIHAMPGSYGADLTEGDVYAGAVYERGAYYYTKGLVGPLSDGSGRSLVESFCQMYPKMRPARILDLGCAIGASSLPWAAAFPDAEVFGIDVGPAILRYGHARSELLGRKVHFSQQDAEKTDFPDDYFDIVATAGVFHETSARASVNIMKEVRRILKPGGLSINSDIPHQHHDDLHDQFMLDWDCHYNSAPFWAQWTAMTSHDLMAKAGFSPEQVWERWRDRDHQGNFSLHDRPKDPSESNQGGIGKGVFWGATKTTS